MSFSQLWKESFRPITFSVLSSNTMMRPAKSAAIKRVSAGYGKIAVLQELETRLQIAPDHTIYMGDGSSDLFVMLHVNSREGYTIAVSEAKFLGRIARRTVLSDSELSVLVPIFEESKTGIPRRYASSSSPMVSLSRNGTRPALTG